MVASAAVLGWQGQGARCHGGAASWRPDLRDVGRWDRSRLGHGDRVGAARAFGYDLDRNSRRDRGRVHLHRTRTRADAGSCRAPRLGRADGRAARRGLRAARRLQFRCLRGRLGHDPAIPGGLTRRSRVVSGDVRADVQANKRRSQRLYDEIFGKGNFAAADELMAPDIVNHGPGAPPVPGTEGIKRQAALLRTAMPDLEVILHDQVGEGDRVASRWTGRGTHAGPLNLPTGLVPATGNAISFDEIRIDRHASGRIVESWWIPDRLTLWTQLGLLPAAPPTGR